MAEQHHVHERGQLPVERHPLQAEAHRDAVGERDADRQRNERHHPRLSRRQFLSCALDERPAAVEKDDNCQNRRDPRRPRKLDRTIPEPLLEQVLVIEDGQREHQAHDKPVAEHLRAVAGMLVVAPLVHSLGGCSRVVFVRVPVLHTLVPVDVSLHVAGFLVMMFHRCLSFFVSLCRVSRTRYRPPVQCATSFMICSAWWPKSMSTRWTRMIPSGSMITKPTSPPIGRPLPGRSNCFATARGGSRSNGSISPVLSRNFIPSSGLSGLMT